MTIAIEQNRSMGVKKETTAGTAAGSSGAQLFAWSKLDIMPDKATFESDEIRPSHQIADFAHGFRKTAGGTEHNLAPSAYAAIFASFLRKAFAATSALTGLSLTVAASGSYWTITRASGDFLSSGLKVGDVIRITAGSFTGNNLNNNFVIISMTSTVLTVKVGNGSTLTAEGPVASATITLPGKKTMVPTTGHTDESWTVEDWMSDKAESILHVGCKPIGASIQLPPTGYAKVGFDWLGLDFSRATSQYFSSPSAISSYASLKAVNAVCRLGSVATSLLGLNFNMKGNHSSDPQVGSNIAPGVLPGKHTTDGQITTYDESGTLFAAFDAETETSLTIVLFTSSSNTADFVSLTVPRIKLGKPSNTKVGNGLARNFPIKPLENTSGGSGTSSDASTIIMQDSTQ